MEDLICFILIIAEYLKLKREMERRNRGRDTEESDDLWEMIDFPEFGVSPGPSPTLTPPTPETPPVSEVCLLKSSRLDAIASNKFCRSVSFIVMHFTSMEEFCTDRRCVMQRCWCRVCLFCQFWIHLSEAPPQNNSGNEPIALSRLNSRVVAFVLGLNSRAGQCSLDALTCFAKLFSFLFAMLFFITLQIDEAEIEVSPTDEKTKDGW